MKKSTLIAVAVFGALLAVFFLTRETGQVNQGVPKLALPALSGDVTSVEMGAVKLTQENGGWKVNGNGADASQVKGLTDALKDFKAQDFVTEKTERHAELEVDDAKGSKMVVSTAAGPSWSLVFGKASKSGGTYVRDAKSNAVFLTSSPLGFQAKKKASDWRAKTIATAQLGDVVKATVTQPSSTFTILLKDGAWQLETPPPAGFRYDAEAAKRIVQSATSLQAQDFTDGLAEQVGTVELELKDGKKVTLKLGAKRAEGGTYPLSVDGDPQVYLLAEWTAQNLLKTQEDLRDTTLLAAFEVEKVNRLSIDAGGKKTVLTKDAGGWKVVEPKTPPAGFELDPQLVTNMLTRLKAMRATKLEPGVSDAAAGVTKPSAVVEVGLEGGAKHALRFGAETPAKNAHYVKGTADGQVYSIGLPQRGSFEQGVESFKKRAMPDMNQMRGIEQLPPEVRRQLEQQLKQRAN